MESVLRIAKDAMAAPITLDTYKEVILFLAIAGVVVPLFHRLRVSPVLGFLGAGALLGPYGLGRLADDVPILRWVTIASREEMTHLAEFGVVFLLFVMGLELSWVRLRRLRRLIFGLGTLQILACSAALAAIALQLGFDHIQAIVAGLALALSSTAIVLPVLAEGKRLNTPTGRTSFAVLLAQDLAVAPILFTVALFGSAQAGADTAAAFFTVLFKALLALVLIVGAGRVLLRPLFRFVAATRSPELFVAASLLVVITASVGAAASGLSMGLGAFVAGLLLAETEYRRAVEATIDPFKGLLLGVFFVSVGMGLDPAWLAINPGLIVAFAVGLIALKAAIIFALASLFRIDRPVAAESALLLGPGGEFAFVTIGAAGAAGLLPSSVGQPLLVVVTVTMLTIPLLARVAAQAGRRLQRQKSDALPAEPPPLSEKGRVVIAGFGRVGQLVADMLARHDVPYIAVDADADLVAVQRRAGKPVYYGDGTSVEFLRACGLDGARALVLTLNAPRATEAVIAAARQARPDLTIVARARDDRHAAALYRLGVYDAVPENFEASLQLSEAVLVDIGVPMGLVIASIHERRDEFRNGLKQTGERSAEDKVGEFRGRRTVGKRA
jgi:monovalent cation:H+ antiporter-2, CPA2 family